ELQRRGLSEADVRTVADAQGKLREVWVRWQVRSNLYFSGPEDRHLVLERARGRLASGGHGRPVPAGRDNVRARRYTSGGGRPGNVPARSITQELGGAGGEGGANPRAADGRAGRAGPGRGRRRAAGGG